MLWTSADLGGNETCLLAEKLGRLLASRKFIRAQRDAEKSLRWLLIEAGRGDNAQNFPVIRAMKRVTYRFFSFSSNQIARASCGLLMFAAEPKKYRCALSRPIVDAVDALVGLDLIEVQDDAIVAGDLLLAVRDDNPSLGLNHTLMSFAYRHYLRGCSGGGCSIFEATEGTYGPPVRIKRVGRAISLDADTATQKCFYGFLALTCIMFGVYGLDGPVVRLVDRLLRDFLCIFIKADLLVSTRTTETIVGIMVLQGEAASGDGAASSAFDVLTGGTGVGDFQAVAPASAPGPIDADSLRRASPPLAMAAAPDAVLGKLRTEDEPDGSERDDQDGFHLFRRDCDAGDEDADDVSPFLRALFSNTGATAEDSDEDDDGLTYQKWSPAALRRRVDALHRDHPYRAHAMRVADWADSSISALAALGASSSKTHVLYVAFREAKPHPKTSHLVKIADLGQFVPGSVLTTLPELRETAAWRLLCIAQHLADDCLGVLLVAVRKSTLTVPSVRQRRRRHLIDRSHTQAGRRFDGVRARSV